MRLRRYGWVAFICMAVLCPMFSQEQVSTQRKISSLTRTLDLSHAEYVDRVQAIWSAQMIAQLIGLRFEHQPASVLRETPLSHPPGHAPVDDDYYYERVPQC